MKGTLPVRLRFGPFELNPRSGELCSSNGRQVLQDQPLLILRMLIERDGELVSRHEIKNKLWPNDTIVEFDHSIHAAISNLRKTLDDSADEPKYIETIPRRGYRLMVPVEWLGAGDSSGEVLGGADGTAARLQLQPGLIGKRVSHYRVLEVIGGGGMGMVYKAEDLKLGREVALKFLPEDLREDPKALGRFEREARVVSALDHPNICPVYEFDEYEGHPFIVMQLLQGRTLREHPAGGRFWLSRPEGLETAIQIAAGLEAAHEKGIIHRDIKPANIFITKKNVAKILDFGVAKVLEASEPPEAATDPVTLDGISARLTAPNLTRTGLKLGTAGYMSPEQVRGEELDARTDIFSLGLVLYEMATGQRAFTGETAAVVHVAILNSEPIPARQLNPDLPSGLEAVINKSLKKDRDQRYQTAAEIRDALQRVRDLGGGVSRAAPFRHFWRWLATAAFVAAMAAGAGLYWRSRQTAKLKAGDAIVVAAFANNTSDPAFGDALGLALETELAQTPFLDVLGPDKVRSTLKLMNHPESEPLSPALAQQVCLHTNSAAVVLGSIADEGNNYRIGLNAVNCKTSSTLASAVANAKSRSVVVRTLGNLSAEFRAKLGEPRNSLQQFNRPLDEATSSSIEALQAFGQAEKARMERGSLDAVPFLKRATDLDSSFALAWTNLGMMYGEMDDDQLQSECMSRAYQLRNRVSRRDAFAIEASYYSLAEGDVDKSIPIYKQWLQDYPRDRIALMELGNRYNAVGENAEAAGLFREAIRLDPNDIDAYWRLIEALMLMGRLHEAVTAYDEAKATRIEMAALASLRFSVAFLQHDTAVMEQLSRSHVPDPESRTLFFATRARVEEYYGRFRNARALWAQAKDYPGRHGSPWNTWSPSVQALSEATAGNSNLALPLARQALAGSRSRTDRGRTALALALAGDDDLAENEARALQREYPVDTILQSFWLPTTRGVVELYRKHPDAAIRELQRASQYEQFGSMLPAYVRGHAYLELGQPAQALAEFKKVLEHPSWTNEWVFGAIAHLQLGRAQAMMGDKAAARKSYQDFLTLWKDADLDIPIHNQAKAEYSKLQ